MDTRIEMPAPSHTLLAKCISVDLEVDPRTAKVFDLAAVRHQDPVVIRSRGGDLEAALDQLEAWLTTADHLVGHNILRHDLPHLAASRPRLRQSANAPIDTLWLNQLAFPRNPYHHLVKHYQDGSLIAAVSSRVATCPSGVMVLSEVARCAS